MPSTYSQWSIRIILIAAYVFALLSIFFLFPFPTSADGSFPFLGVLHAGQRPEAIAVDTQTHLVYIAYEYPAQLVAFDPIGGKVRWHMTMGGSATDVQVDSTTHHVYAVSSQFNDRGAELVVLNGATGQRLLTARTGAGDNGIALDIQRQRIFVTDTNDGEVNVFSLTSSPTGQLRATSATLKLGSHPQALGVDGHLGRLYVGDAAKNVVTVYDEDSGRTLATIAVAATPVQPLRVDETRGRVYVVCSGGQELDVIDEHRNTIMAHVPVSPYPEGVAFNTATGRIYVADEGNKEGSNSNTSTGTTITVIDGQSFDVLGTLQVGHAPDGVEADPSLHRVYVSTEDSDAVVEISDSVDIPLKSDMNFHQITTIRTGIFLLQQATYITLLLMALTIVGATLGVLLPHWRGRGTPQTRPTDASSR